LEVEVISPDWLFDAALAVVLPLLAWSIVAARALRAAVVLFIAFGLLSALAWTRLDAIDVALVEAALGTGFTGALLVSALPWAETPRAKPAPRALPRAAFALVGGSVSLGTMAIGTHHSSDGLGGAVATEMATSGAAHPVTAVLLNFRGYDTLLEVAVLLVAAVAVLAIHTPTPSSRDEAPPAPGLLLAYVHLLVPVGILTAGYLVWQGSHAPGGAFQAAAVLASCGVVLSLTRRLRPPRMSRAVRVVLLMGPGLFTTLAAAPLLGGGQLLEYPRRWAGSLMLALEVALTISIAIILVVFFPSPRKSGPAR
jgi:multisubunit Na+/H+ antiporter MnhB subunit